MDEITEQFIYDKLDFYKWKTVNEIDKELTRDLEKSLICLNQIKIAICLDNLCKEGFAYSQERESVPEDILKARNGIPQYEYIKVKVKNSFLSWLSKFFYK